MQQIAVPARLAHLQSPFAAPAELPVLGLDLAELQAQHVLHPRLQDKNESRQLAADKLAVPSPMTRPQAANTIRPTLARAHQKRQQVRIETN